MVQVVVAGVGMVPFAKPGKSDTYVHGRAGGPAALADAGIAYAVQQAYAGYVYGDSTSGQDALYRVGMTGVPVINVNNNCSTGSSALFLARQAVASGAADCVLALGFEQMRRGALRGTGTTGRARSRGSTRSSAEVQGDVAGVPLAPQVLRRRGRGLLREVRHGPGLLRADLGEGAPARGQQPVRGVHRPGHRRGGAGLAADLRAADPAAVLPADLRRRRRRRGQRGVRPRATGCAPTWRSPRQAMTTDTARVVRRGPDAAGRLRHDRATRRGRSTRRRASDPRRHPGRGTARLLHHQRADQLRGARA